jgi:hypothetical protein
MNWEQAAGAILAVGALGTAAFGIVEAFGKAVALRRWGLPYAGYSHVRVVMLQFADALQFTYGEHYEEILRQQYRDGRAGGQAPDTVRQGVKLALPLMDQTKAQAIVDRVWGVDGGGATLVKALQAEKAVDAGGESAGPSPAETAQAAILAGRFGLALDSRVQAAFALAEERYQALARMLAGVTAVALSLAFNASYRGLPWIKEDTTQGYPWIFAFIVGAAAVPLAPVAKDLSSALTDALKAWKQVGAAKA